MHSQCDWKWCKLAFFVIFSRDRSVVDHRDGLLFLSFIQKQRDIQKTKRLKKRTEKPQKAIITTCNELIFRRLFGRPVEDEGERLARWSSFSPNSMASSSRPSILTFGCVATTKHEFGCDLPICVTSKKMTSCNAWTVDRTEKVMEYSEVVSEDN